MQRIEAIVFDPAGCLTDENALIYEDVIPVLSELKAMGIRMFAASPLPETPSLAEFFGTMDRGSLHPEQTIFLTATEEGLTNAKTAGFNAILMMNDPDEARRLTTLEPAGGIVSLHELPDFIRLVAAQNG